MGISSYTEQQSLYFGEYSIKFSTKTFKKYNWLWKEKMLQLTKKNKLEVYFKLQKLPYLPEKFISKLAKDKS